jgi:hypothetical protein
MQGCQIEAEAIGTGLNARCGAAADDHLSALDFAGAVDVGQHLRLDQKALPLVTPSAPAETHHYGAFFAFRFGAACQQRVACAEKDEIVETGAFQAGWAGILHNEKVAAATASVTCPGVAERLDHDQLGWAVRFLRQALTLRFRKLGRNPMGTVKQFDGGISALAEPQYLPPWSLRDILGLAWREPLCPRPGPEQLHSFRDPRQVRLDDLLQILDLPAAPAFHSAIINPSDADQDVDWAHIMSCRQRRLRSGYDTIHELRTIIHDSIPIIDDSILHPRIEGRY